MTISSLGTSTLASAIGIQTNHGCDTFLSKKISPPQVLALLESSNKLALADCDVASFYHRANPYSFFRFAMAGNFCTYSIPSKNISTTNRTTPFLVTVGILYTPNSAVATSSPFFLSVPQCTSLTRANQVHFTHQFARRNGSHLQSSCLCG